MELSLEAGRVGDQEAALTDSGSSLPAKILVIIFFYLNFNHVINWPMAN